MIERFPVWAPGEHGMERRRVYIYLPDEYYEKPKRQYPVLYMFDGHNVFYDEDATYGKSWGMEQYLQKSGYFCACGKSVLSFLHNISSVLLVRVPGSYLASTLFPDTLFPMGLASAGGSLLSVMLCILFYLKFCREKNPAAQSA